VIELINLYKYAKHINQYKPPPFSPVNKLYKCSTDAWFSSSAADGSTEIVNLSDLPDTFELLLM